MSLYTRLYNAIPYEQWSKTAQNWAMMELPDPRQGQGDYGYAQTPVDNMLIGGTAGGAAGYGLGSTINNAVRAMRGPSPIQHGFNQDIIQQSKFTPPANATPRQTQQIARSISKSTGKPIPKAPRSRNEAILQGLLTAGGMLAGSGFGGWAGTGQR